MNTVYLVSEGSYDDYHVVAVFSTREKAQVFIEAREQLDEHADFNEIVEFEVDANERAIREGLSKYSYVVDVQTGKITVTLEAMPAGMTGREPNRKPWVFYHGPADSPRIHGCITCTDSAPASFVAVEAYREFLRLRETMSVDDAVKAFNQQKSTP